jgi:hypothetical protein
VSDGYDLRASTTPGEIFWEFQNAAEKGVKSSGADKKKNDYTRLLLFYSQTAGDALRAN